MSLYKGGGCTRCNYTGFSGRVGLFELLFIDDDMKRLIAGKVSAEEIHKHALEKGMHTLLQDGMDKIRDGITTPDEVLRVLEKT